MKVINDINKFVSSIANAIEEQSITTKEMARNIAQVTEGISEVNENVSLSSKAIGEIAKDIADVNDSAVELEDNCYQVGLGANNQKKMADQLQVILGRFKI